VCLSQVDRAFEDTGRRVPSVSDVRLPNPVDLSLFSKVCFIHESRVSFEPFGQGEAPRRLTRPDVAP
jgi:hypothetical protein